MTQRELDAAFDVARRAVNAITLMGMSAGKYISDQQLKDVVQDALQAAEDVRKDRK
jgi:hypothetical protein